MTERILLLGATGTIGRATWQALREAGHDVTALVRPSSTLDADAPGVLRGDATNLRDIQDALNANGASVIVSCLASRTGAPDDAWAIDHDAHIRALNAAQSCGVKHFVLLSAICVQKPQLAFQKAKLAFETALIASGMAYSIVRPTAYLKSLGGQIARLQQGKPFLLFGDGRLTACKPISDGDLGRFLALCVSDPDKRNQILPIGGPGPAITPIEMGQTLFDLLDRPAKFRHVPVQMMSAIIGALRFAGAISTRARNAAEFASIGRYYATESMLVWDAAAQRYDADATPEFGTERLPNLFADLIAGRIDADRGDHAVF